MTTPHANKPESVKHLYKILPSAPPNPLPSELPLSQLDANDGFIHLSTAAQTPLTAGRFFTDASQLWILKMKLPVLEAIEGGSMKWEASQNHGVFPHLYGAGLGQAEVEEVLAFERADNGKWEDILDGLLN